MRLVTKTSRRPKRALLDHLRRLGFDVAENELFTATEALVSHFVRNRLRPYLLVHPNLDGEFAGLDTKQPNAEVLGDSAAFLHRAKPHKSAITLDEYSDSPVISARVKVKGSRSKLRKRRLAKDDAARVQLEELLANWSQGDVEKTLSHFSPSIRHRICGTEGFVHMDGSIQGMDAFLHHLEEFSRIWELLHFAQVSIVAEGNRAVSHVTFRYRHIPSGRIVESEAAQFWHFESGKVVELIEFLDTALFASLIAEVAES